MVERVRGRLDQYTTNRPQLATFESLTGDQMALTPAQGYNSMGGTAILEVDHELLQITAFDQTTNNATLPAWGRAQMGTTQTTLSAGKKVIVNPLWPYWHIAQALIDGMRGLYPQIFAVKNTELTSAPLQEAYELPADFEEVLDLRIEWYGPIRPQRQIRTRSVDVSNADGKRYLHIKTIGIGGRPIRITYRAQPTLPTGPDDTTWTWETSGFPASADDLPILRATMDQIVNPELAKTQNFSSEQSDRNRFVQSGAASSASRRMEELFERRMDEERRKLMDRHPVRLYREFNR